MATIIREVLDTTGMKLDLYCLGQTYAGFSLLGTWVGTASFYGSFDGVNFSPLTVTPFPSGTNVQTATGNGNWFVPVQNYQVVRVLFTRTSGSLQVAIAASQDASYQDAFLTTATLYPTSAGTANATNTLTQAAQANRAWKLTALVITVNKQPAWLTSPNLVIKDGTTVIWNLDLPTAGSSGVQYPVPLPAGGLVNTPGNAMSIVVPAAGSGAITNINAAFEPA